MALLQLKASDRASWGDAVLSAASRPAVLAACATGLLVLAYLMTAAAGLSEMLGDTDDAVRLLTVREMLAGGSYFDTTLARIGAPEALVSHWSRLIDVPLATLILLLKPFLGAEVAETVVRAVWPLLLFFALALIVSREVARRAGAQAPLIAMVLVFTCGYAIVQFKPGRIDHHNAQILCAVAGLLFLFRSLSEPRTGWLAGALLGVGLAIGYEALALVVPMLSLAGMLYVVSPAQFRGLLNAILATTGTLTICLFLTTAPNAWLVAHCDALSVNLVSLAAGPAAALWIMSRLQMPLAARFALVAAGAGIGGLLFALAEPKCLAGPFGAVDPALRALWLDHVAETQSLFAFARKFPASGLPQIAFLLMGVAIHVYLAWKRRDAETLLAATCTLLAAVLGFWQIKLTPYVSWLVVVPMTVFAATLGGTGSISPTVLRIFAVLMLSQTTIGAVISTVMDASSGTAAAETAQSARADACHRTSIVRELARFEPGLVAAEIDLGAYVAALTPHRVVAAPYHRLDKGILALNEVMTGPEEKSRAVLRKLGVTYIALCAADADPAPGNLRQRLIAGQAGAGFEELPLSSNDLRFWRVR
ncbi:MAG: hypothetical protein EKK41_18680 [Hyphomicrobiales bacterium]|nr:MAG: hypothetical protein EKK41_18680 [Hyphomicrobiales bacterium]